MIDRRDGKGPHGTALSRVERALRESEVRYRTLVERIPVPVFVQTEGIFRFVNPACVRFFGAQAPEQIVGRPCAELIHPEEHEDVAARIRRVAGEGVSLPTTPRRFVRLDGGVVHTEVTLDPIELDGERGALIVIWDVTEREALLAALRESEARYRALTEVSPAAIYVQVEGILRYVNPATLRLFGEARAEDMLGRALLDYIHPTERGEVAERMQHVREDGSAFAPTPRRFVRRDGSQFTAEVTAVRHTFQGRPGGMAVVRDITDILETQRRLAQSEERYRTLVETSPDTVFLLSAGRIAFVNRAGARMYGAEDPEQLVGMGVLERVHPEDRALMQEGGAVAPAVIRQRRLDGSVFHGEVVSTPVRVAGRPGSLTVVRDVTERHQAEERILALNAELEARVRRRTQQLEDANRELESFSYSVSHDLRAPLRAIHGFSGLLAQQAGAALDDQGRHYLGRIQEASARMGRLIDDLLDLSRVTRAPVRPEGLDLSRLAGQVLEDLRAGDPGRQVEVAIAPGLAARGDPALVRVVLQNLVENAWKFTRGTAAPRIEVGREGEAFFVRDNGAGFDMRYVEKLFGAFQRLHADEQFAGSGIGLATVQRIVVRHGGRVWAEGEPGRGATFRFTLPDPTAGV